MSEEGRKGRFGAPSFRAGDEHDDEKSTGFNPDAPCGQAVPHFARSLPRADASTLGLRMMTPRTVGGVASSSIVMTPRAAPSAFDGPSLPQSRPSSGSGLRTVTGPSKSGTEKSLFRPGYTDRAALRRMGESEPPSYADLTEEVDDKKDGDSVDSPSPVYSAGCKKILQYMGLLPKPACEVSGDSVWEPGRAQLVYDFTRTGLLPSTQVRSQSEIDALGLGRRSDAQCAIDEAILGALSPKDLKAKSHEKEAKSCTSGSGAVDMFADDTTLLPSADDRRHRDKLLTGNVHKKVPTTMEPELPAAVRGAIEAARLRRKAEANEEEAEEPVDPNSMQAVGDYDECYPGVYETAGLEYDEEEEEQNGRKQPQLSKRKTAALEQRQAKRKFDREVSQVERIMKDRLGQD